MFTYNGRKFFGSGSEIRVYDESGQRVELATTEEQTAALQALIGHSAATAYVWGRQDAGEGERDTELAGRFADVYAATVYAYKIGDRHGSYHNLLDAYERWAATGKIGEGYPYRTKQGDVRWACCTSTIGPTCQHRQVPTD